MRSACSETLCLVHNGISENPEPLRALLQSRCLCYRRPIPKSAIWCTLGAGNKGYMREAVLRYPAAARAPVNLLISSDTIGTLDGSGCSR